MSSGTQSPLRFTPDRVSLRDYQDQKADVIYKFNNDEARQLKTKGELPDNIKINEGEVTIGGENDDGEAVEFAEMADTTGPQNLVESSEESDDDLDIDDI